MYTIVVHITRHMVVLKSERIDDFGGKNWFPLFLTSNNTQLCCDFYKTLLKVATWRLNSSFGFYVLEYYYCKNLNGYREVKLEEQTLTYENRVDCTLCLIWFGTHPLQCHIHTNEAKHNIYVQPKRAPCNKLHLQVDGRRRRARDKADSLGFSLLHEPSST